MTTQQDDQDLRPISQEALWRAFGFFSRACFSSDDSPQFTILQRHTLYTTLLQVISSCQSVTNDHIQTSVFIPALRVLSELILSSNQQEQVQQQVITQTLETVFSQVRCFPIFLFSHSVVAAL